jgi:hypothetical protein
MSNKISIFKDFKDKIRDLKWYGKEKGHDTLRHKLKVGYKTQPNHEFVPDQSKLGMHLAILHPESLIVEDIIHTGKDLGEILKLRPIFIQLSPEDQEKIKLGEKHPWMYIEEEKRFHQFEDLVIE